MHEFDTELLRESAAGVGVTAHSTLHSCVCVSENCGMALLWLTGLKNTNSPTNI